MTPTVLGLVLALQDSPQVSGKRNTATNEDHARNQTSNAAIAANQQATGRVDVQGGTA